MSSIKQVGQLAMGKGCTMKFFQDTDQPSDSIDHRWTEVFYDGAPDSWVPEIGAHWHKHHSEWMQVLSGRISFTLDGATTLLTPESAPLLIPRLHVHSFKFLRGEPAILRERTDPTGVFKAEFFEDLFDEREFSVKAALRSFYYGDTYIALPGGFKLVDQVVTLGVGGVVAWLWPQRNKGMMVEGVAKLPPE